MFNVKIGISDHHGIIVTALKSEFIKGDPKQGIIVITKTLTQKHSSKIYYNILKEAQTTDHSYLQNIFTKILNKHASLKKNKNKIFE